MTIHLGQIIAIASTLFIVGVVINSLRRTKTNRRYHQAEMGNLDDIETFSTEEDNFFTNDVKVIRKAAEPTRATPPAPTQVSLQQAQVPQPYNTPQPQPAEQAIERTSYQPQTQDQAEPTYELRNPSQGAQYERAIEPNRAQTQEARTQAQATPNSPRQEVLILNVFAKRDQKFLAESRTQWQRAVVI